MKRRFVLSVVAVVGLVALSRPPVCRAAEAPPPGTITTVAGTGQIGFSGDGGPATQARLNWPLGVVVDAAGNVFFGDAVNNRVRKVTPDGNINTIAGTGTQGFSGDGGPATQARLYFPSRLAVDQAGDLFIILQDRVRRVSPDGIITTVAGTGQNGFSGDGGPATAARLNGPIGIAADTAGNLFIAELGNYRVRKVTLDGVITTVAGSGPTGPGNGVYAGDGGPATQARLRGPVAVTVDAAGNLFIAESGFDSQHPERSDGYRVRKVTPDGIITTVAGTGEAGFSGDGGLATQARLDIPLGLAVDTAGNLFVADYNNYRVRKVDKNGIISTVAGMGRYRYSGDGTAATATGLRGPVTLAVDAAGNLLITETYYNHEADGLGPDERVLKVFGVAAPGLLAGAPFPAP